MKKILFILLFLTLFALPALALALSESQVQVPSIYIQSSALPVAPAKVNFPLKFTVNGSASELKDIKMIKLSAQTICAGTFGFHLQEGDFRPSGDDYKDGKIEGSLNYQPTKDNSCVGKRNIILYFCNQVNNSCLYPSTEKGLLIAKIEKTGVIEIGDNPPDDINPPGDNPPPDDINPPGDNIQPPADQGGGYDPLLPDKGKFLTIWDLLARAVQILLGLAGVVAVAVMIIGGYQYMTAGGIPDKAQIAKTTITYAIIGLLIVIIVFAVLRFVLPLIGVSQEVIWF